jgi:hypothetical protein
MPDGKADAVDDGALAEPLHQVDDLDDRGHDLAPLPPRFHPYAPEESAASQLSWAAPQSVA